MRFQESDIRQLVDLIWASVLGMVVRPADPAPADARGCLTGCVQITGAWQGAVTLTLPEGLVRRAAGILFDVPPEEVNTEQLHDALGELTNIVGGNIKALLPGLCFLALPAVVEGADYCLAFPEGRLLTQTAFQCDGWSFGVQVLEQGPPGRVKQALQNPAPR